MGCVIFQISVYYCMVRSVTVLNGGSVTYRRDLLHSYIIAKSEIHNFCITDNFFCHFDKCWMLDWAHVSCYRMCIITQFCSTDSCLDVFNTMFSMTIFIINISLSFQDHHIIECIMEVERVSRIKRKEQIRFFLVKMLTNERNLKKKRYLLLQFHAHDDVIF